MRTRNILLLVITLVVSLGCSSSGSTMNKQATTKPRNTVTDKNHVGQNLAYYLQQVPGVLVSGSGSNIKVNIRGSASFISSTSPLYVIDGQAVGNSYSQANNMINVRDIDHVKVLKGSEASTYGVRGGNGVIEIFTKND